MAKLDRSEMEDQGKRKRGRPCLYLTIAMFDKFLSNDWYHLKREVAENKWLLRVFLASLIAWALIDRLVG